eukprot:gene9846-2039_t
MQSRHTARNRHLSRPMTAATLRRGNEHTRHHGTQENTSDVYFVDARQQLRRHHHSVYNDIINTNVIAKTTQHLREENRTLKKHIEELRCHESRVKKNFAGLPRISSVYQAPARNRCSEKIYISQQPSCEGLRHKQTSHQPQHQQQHPLNSKQQQHTNQTKIYETSNPNEEFERGQNGQSASQNDDLKSTVQKDEISSEAPACSSAEYGPSKLKRFSQTLQELQYITASNEDCVTNEESTCDTSNCKEVRPSQDNGEFLESSNLNKAQTKERLDRKSKYIEKLKSQITELQEENQLIQEQYATLQREQAANAELHRQIEALQKQLEGAMLAVS